ncbi:hypothetical protein TR2A62_0951 [Thalassobium sp. R2A62]|nr:hypothetical protein TR2A62_0951 [Thalassobium sp. R2A62]
MTLASPIGCWGSSGFGVSGKSCYRLIMRTTVLLSLIMVALAAPISADVTSGGRTIECFCTDSSGGRIELGESICLQVDGRMFTAQCQMSLNVPMWRETQQGCLTGSYNAPQMSPFPADIPSLG